jgi:cytochrome c-type biogenesis protein CcmH/NrfF
MAEKRSQEVIELRKAGYSRKKVAEIMTEKYGVLITPYRIWFVEKKIGRQASP